MISGIVRGCSLLHLLWHRKLGIDLSQPLTDGSVVVAGGAS
ncbi:hypothetical protein [Streptomyces tubercidicus]